MPFFMPAKKIKKLDCVSLQVQQSVKKIKKEKIYKTKYWWKRVCLFTSRGSITLEATLSLVIFLMVAMFMQEFLIITQTQISVQICMDNIVREIGKEQYYLKMADEVIEKNETAKSIKEKIEKALGLEEQEDGDSGLTKKKLVNAGYFYAKFVLKSKRSHVSTKNIVGGLAGFRVLGSKVKDGVSDMVMRYDYRMPYLNKKFSILQRSRIKDWSGVDITQSLKTVYITKTGSVYHTTKECSAINLKIKKADFSQVLFLRNNQGEKYKKCEICARATTVTGTEVFITEEGNRYHNSLQCSGLKRDVIAIDFSQIGERRACSKCGK